MSNTILFSDSMFVVDPILGDAVSINTLPEETSRKALHWADVLDDPESVVPRSLPPFPENPFIDMMETFLSSWAKACAEDGLKAAQKIGHDPLAPHLAETARPGASTFNPNSSPLDWTPDQCNLLRVEGGPGVRIFVLDNPLWAVGVCRNTPIDPAASYTMKMVHGCLQPVGATSTTEWATHTYTLVFTWEGPEHGWVLASVHPGEPDPPANREGLEEGQIVLGSELILRGFVRAIPEA